MAEVYVIERMLIEGFWELFLENAYVSEKKAVNDCLSIIKEMQKKDKTFTARVTKLSIIMD